MLTSSAQTTHPCLLLTQSEVTAIKDGVGKYPLFTSAFEEAKQDVERALAEPLNVPVPQDAAGETHERHKQNYRTMQRAGILFQVTRDERYARFVHDMLLKYAELYPTLKRHPQAINNDGGRLFWQTLNETVWLVNTAEAYDCVYDWLTPKDRKTIETNVFRPIAKFFIEEHAETLDRIHNHGTWMSASIGMLGYVLYSIPGVANSPAH